MSSTSTSSNGSSSSTSEGSTSRLYAMHDQWHVTSVATAAGTVVERYAYEAFGTSIVLSPSFNIRSTSLFDWETRFGAYRFDDETLLYCVRFRYFHPEIGRWMSRDSLGEEAGMNLLAYTTNAPGNRTDPAGLIDVDEFPLSEAAQKLFPDGDIPPWVRGQINRGCVGITMVAQHCPGDKPPAFADYPEYAPDTKCFLSKRFAEGRECKSPKKNFVFGKYGPWKDGKKPESGADGSVPLNSIEPPASAFNYVACLKNSQGRTVYVWADYGAHVARATTVPPKCYVSLTPFATNEKYPNVIWCSTCVCPTALGAT